MTRLLNGRNPFRIVEPRPAIKDLPRLLFGLEKVLEKKGPVFLVDEKSGKFNFDPYLFNIPQLDSLKIQNLKPFVRAAQDLTLHQIGRDNGCIFNSSTSSITGSLSQLYHLILNKTRLDTTKFSSDISGTVSSHSSPFLRSGSEVQLVFNDGVYTIDAIAPSSFISDLMIYGHVLELFLTTHPDEFKNIFVSSNEQLDTPELYSYGKFDDILIRSQLDAQDPLRSMAFDLKTRAVLTIRKSLHNYKENLWYEIIKKYGVYQSFEREYYDMLRSAFLKYSLQARIGNMRGIFCAYHNTQKLFGFEFISLEEMERDLFGSQDFADAMFRFSLESLNMILLHIVKVFPHQNTKVLFSRPSNNNMMIFAEPLEPKIGQIPLHLSISSTASVNGTPIKKISHTDLDGLEVKIELQELPYDPVSHQAKEKAYRKLHSGINFGGRFIKDLKMKLGYRS